MEILICQQCGAILRQRGKNCGKCGVAISKYSVTALPVITQDAHPLVVQVAPDPMVLERLVSKRQTAMVLERPQVAPANGGGNGGPNGHSGSNGPGASLGNGAAQAAGAVAPGQNGHPVGASGHGSENGQGNGNGHGNGSGHGNGIGHASGAASVVDLGHGQTPQQPVADANFFGAAMSGAPQTPQPAAQPQQAAFFPGTEPSPNAPMSAPMPAAPDPNQGSSVALKVADTSQQAAPGQAAAEFFGQQQPQHGQQNPLQDQPLQQSHAAPAHPPAVIPQQQGQPGAPVNAQVVQQVPGAMMPPQTAVSAEQVSQQPAAVPAQAPPAMAEGQAQQGATAITNNFNVAFGTAFDFFGNPQGATSQPQQAAPEQAQQQAPQQAAPSAEVSQQGHAAAAPSQETAAQTEQQSTQAAPHAQPGESPPADFFNNQQKPAPASHVVPPNPAELNPILREAPPSSVKSSPGQGLNPGLPPSAAESAARANARAEEKAKAKANHDVSDPPTVIVSPAPGADGKNMAAQAVMDFFSSSSFKPATNAPAGESTRKTFADPETRPERLRVDDDSKELVVDDEDDIKPKVARPRGFTPKKSGGKKSESFHDEDEEIEEEHHDEDEEEDEKEKERKPRKSKASADIPARRSFSGAKDTESPEEDLEDSSGNFLKQKIVFAGTEMTRQNQFMLVGICAFVLLVMVSTITSLFVGGAKTGSQSAQQQVASVGGMPAVAGLWLYGVTNQGVKISGGMHINQAGLAFEGDGKDRYGSYLIKGGALKAPSKIHFEKYYYKQDGSLDKPIAYDGEITVGSNPLYMKGIWSVRKRVGMSWRAQMVEYNGLWEGYLKEPAAPGPGRGDPPLKQGGALVTLPDLKQDQKLLLAAGFIVLIAVGFLGVSFTLFGPSGKMNVWEKQKYIPSQFKSQHNKMVKELAGAPQPGGLPLGKRCEWKPWFFWTPKQMSLTPAIRATDPHMLVVGAGDKGKTRLLCNMITYDIEANDRAVIVIDSDGGMTDLITNWIAAHPKGRDYVKRVSVLDPTYRGDSPGYNPLEMPEDEDLQSAASSLVHGFKAIYTEPPGSQSQWNQQTANILRNSALLLMVNGKTLTDLPTLLNDNDFRDVLLEAVERKKKEKTEYITLLDTWGQYKRLARTDQWITWVEPILNRVGPMLSDSRIRSILTKPASDIKLKKLIEEKRILIVKVPKGQLDQNANLLGSLIVTGIKQAALSLANERSKNQNPVALYLDEFDNFIEKETIEAITTETEKFKIGFIGAIKTLQHLPEDFRHQLVIAFGTIACFALAKKDGDLLGPQMFRVDGRKIKHQTISNYFNKVNTSPQFELISDEEKLNIDRVVGQEARTFFAYRVGTVAGVFHLKSADFNDIPDSQVNKKLLTKMHTNSQGKKKEGAKKEAAAIEA